MKHFACGFFLLFGNSLRFTWPFAHKRLKFLLGKIFQKENFELNNIWLIWWIFFVRARVLMRQSLMIIFQKKSERFQLMRSRQAHKCHLASSFRRLHNPRLSVETYLLMWRNVYERFICFREKYYSVAFLLLAIAEGRNIIFEWFLHDKLPKG